jgi:hypothetical protein
MLIVIGLAQFALMFVVSFGLIASAVCALLGPLFVPFFIVRSLNGCSRHGSSPSFSTPSFRRRQRLHLRL